MIKRIFINVLIILSFSSCENGRKPINIDHISLETRFQRFDSAFFNLDTAQFSENLENLKKAYPPFFKSGETDRFWRFQRLDKRQNELFAKVTQKLSPFEPLNEQLNQSLKYFYAQFKNHPPIQAYTYISNLDFDLPTFYNDSTHSCFLATDLYLGQDQPYYAFLPNYLAYDRQPAFIVRDCMEAILTEKITSPEMDANVLDYMIYHGKILFALQSVMPNAPEAVLLKYPKDKMEFALKNERSIWAYFVENQLLFSKKNEDIVRFMRTAPFTRFGMRFDNQSPGRMGQWIGLQIVKNYMQKHPQTTLTDLLKEQNAQHILKRSGYRPE